MAMGDPIRGSFRIEVVLTVAVLAGVALLVWALLCVADIQNVALAKDVVQVLSSLGTLAAAAAAAVWFYYTGSFRRRVQFDIGLQVMDAGDPSTYAAEVTLIVENKGQREHRLYNLFCEVRQSSVALPAGKPPAVYLPLENWAKTYDYYFVASGVRQTFSRPFKIPKDQRLVRVHAVFGYNSTAWDLPALDKDTLKRVDDDGFVFHYTSRLFPVEVKHPPA